MQIITGFHAVEEMLRSPLCTANGAKPHIEYAKSLDVFHLFL